MEASTKEPLPENQASFSRSSRTLSIETNPFTEKKQTLMSTEYHISHPQQSSSARALLNQGWRFEGSSRCAFETKTAHVAPDQVLLWTDTRARTEPRKTLQCEIKFLKPIRVWLQMSRNAYQSFKQLLLVIWQCIALAKSLPTTENHRERCDLPQIMD